VAGATRARQAPARGVAQEGRDRRRIPGRPGRGVRAGSCVKAFAYRRAETLAEGVAAAAAGAVVLAGGTDLLPLMKGRLRQPEWVVDISRARRGREPVARTADGGLRLDGLATLAEIAADPRVRAEYPCLAEAAASSATPQLRNMATLGGNLCQWNRCWYFRGGIPCHLTGADDCPAARGDNRYHALWADGPCVAVHPSDPAVALRALGAIVEISGPEGERAVALGEFLRAPGPGRPDQTDLRPGELVVGVRLPAAGGRRSAYEKAMDRKVWAFALVSVAVVLGLAPDGTVTEAEVVLGGVAPVPHPAQAAAAALLGRRLDAQAAEEAAEAATVGARPLAHNRYKVALLRGVVRAALERLRLTAGAA
jgi:xanthine dehydrogenase YagS FAD-binding subunit